MRDAVLAKGLVLSAAVQPGLPAVSVDRQRISHVFTNLVSNAIKHSPEGGEILVRAARLNQGEIQFSVVDRGPGVPEEHKARIFDRFFRVPGQKKTGAGLGLSIAREIVLAHGGRIGVKRAVDHGSDFFVVLEAVQASN
jgi:signal transduction histidine kinase